MNKEIWTSPEVMDLGIENTEGNHWCGENHDGEYRDWDVFHLFERYS